jgi:putative endonuclease
MKSKTTRKEEKIKPTAKQVWSLYLLECEDGSLYTGISPDPAKRFEAHCRGQGAAYTRMHRPRVLLFSEAVGSYSQALRRERQVKKLSKKSKIKFVENPLRLPQPPEPRRSKK